jgi:uncharacterized protein (TIGR04255 family)
MGLQSPNVPTSPLPSFQQPPVVETVLAVQFQPVAGLTNAHLGAYWKSLGTPWTQITEVDALPQVNEPVGEDHWSRGAMIELRIGPQSSRLRVINSENDRMIQVQNGWFVYNWRRTSRCQAYPRYSAVRIEFDQALSRFREFMSSEGFSNVHPTLWEVTYVNHVDRGPLWDSARDWTRLFGGLVAEPPLFDSLEFEGTTAEWRFAIQPPGQGRLHVHLQDARRPGSDQSAVETVVLRLTARGNLTETDHWMQLNAGLDVGREAVVRTFASITSDEAHRHWKRDR